MRTILRGTGTEVAIDTDGPLVVVGERINPSGRKRMASALARGDMSSVRDEAIAQVQAGARVIDVNVSSPDGQEESLLPLAVQTVAAAVDVPIAVDTSSPTALAAALAVCPGKPLVNSVTAEASSLSAILPLVREHGCAVIGLCLDEAGIPVDASTRVELALKIIQAAADHGIGVEDIVIDPLALTVGADTTAAVATLEAIRTISASQGVNTILGGSNISFGLPDRGLINRSFLAMAMAAGLSSSILDPLDVEIFKTVSACDLLLGRDEYAMRFVQRYQNGWRLT